MKKILAILLALILVLGMVACGTTTETKEETTTETKEEPKKEEPKEEEKAEETTEEEAWPMLQASAIVFTSTGFTPKAESAGVDYYREKYGVDLEVLPVDSSTNESWNIFWAGGGYADLVVPYGRNQVEPLIDEGVLRPIQYEWFQEYMPRMYALLQTSYGTDDAIRDALTIQGEVWCIPWYRSSTTNYGQNTAFRNDWLEAVGLETPKTIEELEEVVRAFAEDDPDGNGVDDTYAFTTKNWGVYSLAAAFETSYSLSYWTAEDGKSMYTNATTQEYRDYLATLNKWYEAGWIDPEFLTDGRAEARNKLAAGTIGIYSDNAWWMEFARGEIGPLQMLEAGQGVDYSTGCSFTTYWPSVYDGTEYHNADLGDICGQASIYFGDAASDELVIRMMQIIDEAVILFSYDEEDLAAQYENAVRSKGIEGTHWEVGEDGRIIVHAGPTAEEFNETGVYMFPVAEGNDLDRFIGAPDEFDIVLYQEAHGDNKIWNGKDRLLPALSTISTELNDKSVNVNDYFDVAFAQFVSGELDINDDAVWAEYCATLEEYGINDIIAAYEEYYGM